MYIINSLNNKKVVLDAIGKISPYALKKGRKYILNKNEYLNVPFSFLSMLVGFIDGDGYICIAKTKKKYIKLCLVISLSIKDIGILEYIQSNLKIGKINSYPKSGEKHTCKLVINKTDLQDVFFPLLIYHNLFFLTKVRNLQYNKALYILRNDIKLYYDVPENLSPYYLPLSKTEDYLNLNFFDNWIVGFTIAEGSFLIKNNQDACFQLRQRMNPILFESLKLRFNTKRKIGIDGNNMYYQLSVSSKEDIQRVIDFFSLSYNHPLLGLKLISYEKWLIYLKNSKRYKDLHYPI